MLSEYVLGYNNDPVKILCFKLMVDTLKVWVREDCAARSNPDFQGHSSSLRTNQ